MKRRHRQLDPVPVVKTSAPPRLHGQRSWAPDQALREVRGAHPPHRTLYVKTDTGGRSKWFRLFWACTRCGSLNHIVLPVYRLERVSSHLPSVLAIAVVKALEEGPLDLDELIVNLRKRQIPGVHHIFNSAVATALEFLKGRGAVEEVSGDRTTNTCIVIGGTHFTGLLYAGSIYWNQHTVHVNTPYSVNEISNSEFAASGGSGC